MTGNSTSRPEPISISLQRTAAAGAAVVAELLAPYGVSFAQWRVLISIVDQGPQSMKQIADLADITPSAASRLVDRMVRGGMLVRQTDPQDRRGAIVTVNERFEALGLLPSIGRRAEAILLADLSRDEEETLGHLSRKIQRTAGLWLAASERTPD